MYTIRPPLEKTTYHNYVLLVAIMFIVHSSKVMLNHLMQIAQAFKINTCNFMVISVYDKF